MNQSFKTVYDKSNLLKTVSDKSNSQVCMLLVVYLLDIFLVYEVIFGGDLEQNSRTRPRLFVFILMIISLITNLLFYLTSFYLTCYFDIKRQYCFKAWCYLFY